MNCRSCQYDLSQCLDGRLPSGRRKVVMDHVAGCDACSEFWSELQRAQELVLQLPRERTSADFRERLFERIDAGEGTPAAVFDEPIPLHRKVRYVASGAAAAAAVLVIATIARDERRDGGPTSSIVTAQLETAATNDGGDVGHGGLTPRQPEGPPAGGPGNSVTIEMAADARPAGGAAYPAQPTQAWQLHDGQFLPTQIGPTQWASVPFGAVWPLTTNTIAVEAARQIERRIAATNESLQSLDVIEKTQPREPAAAAYWARAVCDNAIKIKDIGEVLIDLRERNRVGFTSERVFVDLQVVVERLRQDAEQLRQGDLEAVKGVVGPVLRGRDGLTALVSQIQVTPELVAQPEFHVYEFWQRRPEVFRILFRAVPSDDADALRFDVQMPGRRFLLFDSCNMIQVAPRSEFDARRR